MAAPPTFLTLPPEIRDLVYEHLLAPASFKLPDHDDPARPGPDGGPRGYRFDLRPLRINRQTHAEARAVFRRHCIFVAIDTPWAAAETHVAVEGHVPLAVRGERARLFTAPHMRVRIEFAPWAAAEAGPDDPQRFCVLLEDLPAFCQVWLYSDLGNPGLNEVLRVRLALGGPGPGDGAAADPRVDRRSTCEPLPVALQRLLLLPFGRVKGLDSVVIEGVHDRDVEQALRAAMAEPHATAEACLEAGTRLKESGNAALQAGRPREAIARYEEAFLAIHIVVAGRRRNVWADRFFQRALTTGEFKGQHGLLVRALLRCHLVANVMLAYLKLNEPAEAHFWGNRTIALIDGGGAGHGPPRHEPGFAAAKEFGKIYYRTALAAKALGDASEARRHLAVAAEYLPHDPVVRKERESLALPLL